MSVELDFLTPADKPALLGLSTAELQETAKTALDQLERVTLTSRAIYHDRFGPFCKALAELCAGVAQDRELPGRFDPFCDDQRVEVAEQPPELLQTVGEVAGVAAGDGVRSGQSPTGSVPQAPSPLGDGVRFGQSPTGGAQAPQKTDVAAPQPVQQAPVAAPEPASPAEGSSPTQLASPARPSNNREQGMANGEPGRDGKPAGFAQLKPESLQKSGLEGIATRHGYRVERTALALYNLKDDIGERRNIADQHPEVVRRLEVLAEKARRDLGDSLTNRTGAGIRPAGREQDRTAGVGKAGSPR